ncbi:MarR family transcriptional regulator [Aestuariimicrobium ganziense]|uniref:MarR family transcriptional regulator n=1 Tax=Aestuariimicrobium ganziense TaxID=2773677 RepID=UPI001943B9A4|nr:helix-turn-helix domain-containing protein [Aestuariimicrobium ganziense]
MRTADMFRLGGILRDAAKAASVQGTDAHATPAEITVASDVAMFPDSTIGEIVARTGLSQGAVSRIVARVVAAGYLEVAKDPADARRTRVRVATRAVDNQVASAGNRDASHALADLGRLDDAQQQRASELLAELWSLLGPADHGQR